MRRVNQLARALRRLTAVFPKTNCELLSTAAAEGAVRFMLVERIGLNKLAF